MQLEMLGGKVFIAHLFTYAMDNHFAFLEELVTSKIIDGVEAYYSTYTDEQTASLVEFCTKSNLLMSAGTDCHGDRKPDRKIGVGYGSMNVSESIIKDWVE